jgi:arsenate reductase (thioredoxin)
MGALMVTLTRMLVVLAGALTAVPLLAQSGVPSPEVVFVCEHGAAKSVIAAGHFNKIARERGLNIHAVARGTNPDPEVAPKVVAGLKSEGVTDITVKPQRVTEQDTTNAKRVITLGCMLPHRAKTANWNDIPPPSLDYSTASRAIRERVKALINELSTTDIRNTK